VDKGFVVLDGSAYSDRRHQIRHPTFRVEQESAEFDETCVEPGALLRHWLPFFAVSLLRFADA
jgi:hypothetical protein